MVRTLDQLNPAERQLCCYFGARLRRAKADLVQIERLKGGLQPEPTGNIADGIKKFGFPIYLQVKFLTRAIYSLSQDIEAIGVPASTFLADL